MEQLEAERLVLRDDLVSLPAAALRVFFELCGRNGTEEETNAVAGALACFMPVYRISYGRERLEQVSEADFDGSRFREGGRVLWFEDGRAPLADLVVAEGELAAAIEMLLRGARTDPRS